MEFWEWIYPCVGDWALDFSFLLDVVYRRTVGVSGTSTWIVAYRMNLFFPSTYERGTTTVGQLVQTSGGFGAIGF